MKSIHARSSAGRRRDTCRGWLVGFVSFLARVDPRVADVDHLTHHSHFARGPLLETVLARDTRVSEHEMVFELLVEFAIRHERCLACLLAAVEWPVERLLVEASSRLVQWSLAFADRSARVGHR